LHLKLFTVPSVLTTVYRVIKADHPPISSLGERGTLTFLFPDSYYCKPLGDGPNNLRRGKEKKLWRIHARTVVQSRTIQVICATLAETRANVPSAGLPPRTPSICAKINSRR
jgi:hypothetical protein